MSDKQMDFLLQKEEKSKKYKMPTIYKDAAKKTIHQFQSLVEKSHYLDQKRVQDVYKNMDSSLEGFFFKRKMNLYNFNFLLQIISEQKDLKRAQDIFQKMKELNIQPNQITYNFMVKTCAKVQNQDLAEQYYQDAKKSVGLNLQILTSLMNLYCRKQDPYTCEKLILEAKEIGLKVDCAVYTNLINSYYKARNLKKCCKNIIIKAQNPDVEVDEVVIGLMIEISSQSNDTERGLNLFNDLETEGISQSCITYNAMIKSYSSRSDYAQDGINLYHRMIKMDIQPDSDTFVHLMKACQSLGDIQTAYNAIITMKEYNMPIEKYHINQMIKIYASAIKKDFMKQNLIESYLKDSWVLVQQAIEQNLISVNILNSLVQVYANCLKEDHIQGLILPLYDQLNIKKNVYTYQFIMEMFQKQNDIAQIFRLFKLMQIENIQPNFNVMVYYLDCAIALQDKDKIIQSLKIFQQLDREPKPQQLKTLGNAQQLPEEILNELFKFDLKFGYVRKYARKPAIKEETELEMLQSGAIKI